MHNIEQFVFLIADDPPMTCPRLDHFGLSVGAEEELDEILARARAWQERDDRVEIIDKKVDDHGMIAITSIYVRYLLPMMIEIQWWDFKGMPGSADARSEVTAAGAAVRRVRAAGLEARVHRLGRGDAWERTKELAQLTEQLGYHHLWVYDHVETVPRREPTHVFEAFTTLAALAQHTSTIKLGQLVTCAAYRNAGLLAKEAACVDVFSGGRLILGLGAGWYEREYQAYGFAYPSGGTRLADPRRDARGREAALDRGDGRRSRASTCAFDGAYCDPKPIQQLPEIWVGGGGEKVTLRIEARHADKTNWQTGIEGFVRKSGLLEQYCDEIGRDFDSIVRTHGPDCRRVRHRGRPAAVARLARRRLAVGPRRPTTSTCATTSSAPPSRSREKVQEYVDAGCREFVLWFRDYPVE